jgi:integral membrane protein (TIGR01906 family)
MAASYIRTDLVLERCPVWRELLFGAAFLVLSVGAAANFWGHERSYYANVVAELRLDRAAFHFADGDRAVPLATILSLDDETRRYVLDAGPVNPLMRRFFDANELAHLEDVRGVFGSVVNVALTGGVLAVVAGLGLARRRIRRAALVDAALVVVFGAIAALAFEPLFLAFHEIFFPQGNFLFDPARENLTLVYPEDYWLGVTLRLGATVIAASLLVGGLVSLPIRSNAARAFVRRND